MARSKAREKAGFQFGARQLGISYEEYRAHRVAGELWCWTCKAWRPVDAFYLIKTGPKSGRVRQNDCRICTKARAEAFKAAYLAEHGVPYVPKRELERRRRRNAS